jgi:hypothetical protein
MRGPRSGRARQLGPICALVLAAIACNIQAGPRSEADLPGTITAQALALEARASTASPAATITGEAEALTDYPAPAAPAAAAPSTPKPTRPPKASKTPQPTIAPTATATWAGPNYPTFYIFEKKCSETTVNGRPFWVQDMTISWHDNSNDEDGFRMYKDSKEHPGAALLQTFPPNHTLFLYQISFDKESVRFEPWDRFYLEAFNSSGASLRVANVMYRCPAN